MRTFARRDGDHYVLDGSKRFITNAGVAHTYTVFAKTDASEGHAGISAFMVEADDPGFRVGRMEHKMGIRGSTTGDVHLESCRIPADRLLAGEGEGFRIAMEVLDRSRPGVAAQALGLAQGAIDYAVAYAKSRVAFGKPIAAQQGLQFMLADMQTRTEGARLLLYKVGEMIDAGETGSRLTRMSAMAKLLCSDVAMDVTTDAVQVLGGYGYIREYGVERMMRDAKILQIFDGTNQIQRLVIARHILQ
jgi:alkylation response protein AidB-like acyl-CoA dehydrogenase